MEAYRIRLQPNSTHTAEPHGIGGLKTLTVFSGELKILIGGESSLLNKGDAISFSTDVDQVYQNLSSIEVCEYSMVIYYSNPLIHSL